VSRRKPLTREERQKRAAKKAARTENSPLREAAREARKFTRPARAFLTDPLAQAAAVYRFAVAAALLDEPELVVCERCGLIQENHRGFANDEGVAIVSPCPGWESIGCGSLFAVTPESFEQVRHVTI
jgi:hypothetical protein